MVTRMGSHDEITGLIKRKELELLSLPHEDMARRRHRKEAHSKYRTCHHPILGCLGSGSVSNKCLFFKPHSLWSIAYQPAWTKTISKSGPGAKLHLPITGVESA